MEVDDGVDLYDDMITSSARRDSESQDGPSTSPAPVANNVSASGMNNGKPPSSTDSHGSRESSSIQPLRKFQVYVGNLTWVREGVGWCSETFLLFSVVLIRKYFSFKILFPYLFISGPQIKTCKTQQRILE